MLSTGSALTEQWKGKKELLCEGRAYDSWQDFFEESVVAVLTDLLSPQLTARPKMAFDEMIFEELRHVAGPSSPKNLRDNILAMIRRMQLR